MCLIRITLRFFWKKLFFFCLLGCEALDGPLFAPVVDGIDVGGVCKLACPEQKIANWEKNFFFNLMEFSWNFNTRTCAYSIYIYYIYLALVHCLVHLDSCCSVAVVLIAAKPAAVMQDVEIGWNDQNCLERMSRIMCETDLPMGEGGGNILPVGIDAGWALQCALAELMYLMSIVVLSGLMLQ